MKQGARTDLASQDAKSISQPEAAERLGVSRESVQRAKVVLDKGAPELAEAVEADKITVKEAALKASEPAQDGPNASIRYVP